MKGAVQVVIIWMIVLASALFAFWYVNHCLDAIKVDYAPNHAQTAPESLTIQDTGFNSPSDALQTTTGVFVYQNPPYNVQ
jgi:hypothetical protein